MTSGSERSLSLIAVAVMAASPVVACTAEETPMPSRTPVVAQTAPVTAVEEVHGLWSIREGDGRCRIALSADKRGAGHSASVERCAVPALAKASLWRPVAGGFELLGSGDTLVARFRMTGVDGFESMDGRLKGERAVEF